MKTKISLGRFVLFHFCALIMTLAIVGCQNEVSQNEVSQNEVSQNEVSQNEVSQNEVSQNEVSQNEVSKPARDSISDNDAEYFVVDPVSLKRGKGYKVIQLKRAMDGLNYGDRVRVNQQRAPAVISGLSKASAKNQFELGNEELENRRFVDAIRHFTKAVILDSDNDQYLACLGKSLLHKRKLDDAETAFRTALFYNPNHFDARLGLAQTLDRKGRLSESIEAYQMVLNLENDQAEAHGRLAVLHYYANRFEDAKAHLDQAEKLGQRLPSQLKSLLRSEPITAFRADITTAPIIGPQVRIDSDGSAEDETTIIASEFDPDHVVAAWNDIGTSSMGVGVSVDGGATWNDFIVSPPPGFGAASEGDPMTATDNQNGDIWVGAIAFFSDVGGIFVARKNAGDALFQPTVMARIVNGVDKGWMAAGVDPNDPNQTRIYIACLDINTVLGSLIISTDRGDTWSNPVSLPFGQAFCPRVGPDGQLYMSYRDFGFGVKMVRSFDGGNTFDDIEIATRMDAWDDGSRTPGEFRVPPFTTMAVDPNNGNLYVTYFDTTNIVDGNRNVDIYFCKSSDEGSTWSQPVVINSDSDVPGDQFFSWIEVDHSGRLQPGLLRHTRCAAGRQCSPSFDRSVLLVQR